MLNDYDLNRYSRQIIMPYFEEKSQEILLSKKVLIIGAGGLGCPTALYCSASGFGFIEIWDYDNVEISNLNRQIGHKEVDLGKNKSESLAQTCKELNSSIDIIHKNIRLNFQVDISKYDIIFDCSDNEETRYTINRLAHENSKLLISGSATQFEGQLMVIKSGLDNNLPCYECVFPKSETNFTRYNCREVGILGSVTSLIASLQVNEGIREIIKLNTGSIQPKNIFLSHSNASFLINYDASLLELTKIKIVKNNDCKICN